MEEKNNSRFLMYQTEDGQTRVEVRLEGDSLWLTQQSMATLFQTTKQNISLHLKNIFQARELNEEAVVKEYLTTASDKKEYSTKFYNLEAIISVGYRVRSQRGIARYSCGIGGKSLMPFCSLMREICLTIQAKLQRLLRTSLL